MGFFDELFGISETKAKDEKARELRNAAMKRRRDEQDAEDKARQQRVMQEMEMIKRQADNRKKGWW